MLPTHGAVPYVLQRTVEAGTVLILAEALLHYTVPPTANHERHALLAKHTPITRRATTAPPDYRLPPHPAPLPPG